ncbi:MAG: methyltransferase domain-containing protein, partial [Candidatus Omnitrophica bacterium]|nr:methyltransferase domain-containing protein [Candidatus Omnitrophota bacterium]
MGTKNRVNFGFESASSPLEPADPRGPGAEFSSSPVTKINQVPSSESWYYGIKAPLLYEDLIEEIVRRIIELPGFGKKKLWISIEGLSGVGKTTLSKQVFNRLTKILKTNVSAERQGIPNVCLFSMDWFVLGRSERREGMSHRQWVTWGYLRAVFKRIIESEGKVFIGHIYDREGTGERTGSEILDIRQNTIFICEGVYMNSLLEQIQEQECLLNIYVDVTVEFARERFMSRNQKGIRLKRPEKELEVVYNKFLAGYAAYIQEIDPFMKAHLVIDITDFNRPRMWESSEGKKEKEISVSPLKGLLDPEVENLLRRTLKAGYLLYGMLEDDVDRMVDILKENWQDPAVAVQKLWENVFDARNPKSEFSITYRNYQQGKGRYALGLIREALQGISGVVVDVGCGRRNSLLRAMDKDNVADQMTHLLGSDIHPFISDCLYGRVDYRQQVPPEKLPFEDNSVDAVILFGVIHHTDNAMTGKMFNEIFRILKPFGRLIIVESSFPNQSDKFPSDTRIGKAYLEERIELAKTFERLTYAQKQRHYRCVEVIGTWFAPGALIMPNPYNYKTVEEIIDLLTTRGFVVDINSVKFLGFPGEKLHHDAQSMFVAVKPGEKHVLSDLNSSSSPLEPADPRGPGALISKVTLSSSPLDKIYVPQVIRLFNPSYYSQIVFSAPERHLFRYDADRSQWQRFKTWNPLGKRLSFSVAYLKDAKDCSVCVLALVELGSNSEKLETWVIADDNLRLFILDFIKHSTLPAEYVMDQASYDSLAMYTYSFVVLANSIRLSDELVFISEGHEWLEYGNNTSSPVPLSADECLQIYLTSNEKIELDSCLEQLRKASEKRRQFYETICILYFTETDRSRKDRLSYLIFELMADACEYLSPELLNLFRKGIKAAQTKYQRENMIKAVEAAVLKFPLKVKAERVPPILNYYHSIRLPGDAKSDYPDLLKTILTSQDEEETLTALIMLADAAEVQDDLLLDLASRYEAEANEEAKDRLSMCISHAVSQARLQPQQALEFFINIGKLFARAATDKQKDELSKAVMYMASNYELTSRPEYILVIVFMCFNKTTNELQRNNLACAIRDVISAIGFDNVPHRYFKRIENFKKDNVMQNNLFDALVAEHQRRVRVFIDTHFEELVSGLLADDEWKFRTWLQGGYIDAAYIRIFITENSHKTPVELAEMVKLILSQYPDELRAYWFKKHPIGEKSRFSSPVAAAVITEDFIKRLMQEDNIKTLRFLAREAGIDMRTCDTGLNPIGCVILHMANCQVVNPDHIHKVMLAGASGPSVSDHLLATDADEIYFVDIVPFDISLAKAQLSYGWSDFDGYERVCKYRNNKLGFGFAPGESQTIHRMRDIELKLLVELKDMGVDKDTVNIDEADGVAVISFDWAYKGYEPRRRTLTYIQADIKNPSLYPAQLKKALERGIDIYCQKAAYDLPACYYEFLPCVARAVRDSGYMLTSDISDDCTGTPFEVPEDIINEILIKGADRIFVTEERITSNIIVPWSMHLAGNSLKCQLRLKYGIFLRMRQKLSLAETNRLKLLAGTFASSPVKDSEIIRVVNRTILLPYKLDLDSLLNLGKIAKLIEGYAGVRLAFFHNNRRLNLDIPYKIKKITFVSKITSFELTVWADTSHGIEFSRRVLELLERLLRKDSQYLRKKSASFDTSMMVIEEELDGIAEEMDEFYGLVEDNPQLTQTLEYYYKELIKLKALKNSRYLFLWALSKKAYRISDKLLRILDICITAVFLFLAWQRLHMRLQEIKLPKITFINDPEALRNILVLSGLTILYLILATIIDRHTHYSDNSKKPNPGSQERSKGNSSSPKSSSPVNWPMEKLVGGNLNFRYLRRVCEVVNGESPQDGRREKTAFLIGPAADISTAYLATGASRFIFVEKLPFHADLRLASQKYQGELMEHYSMVVMMMLLKGEMVNTFDSPAYVDEDGIVKLYLMEKSLMGFVSYEILGMCKGAWPFLRKELEIIAGGNIDLVTREGSPRSFVLNFMAGQRERSLIFIENTDGLKTDVYENYLNTPQGVDFIIIKAGDVYIEGEKFLLPSRIVEQFLRPGGFVIVDSDRAIEYTSKVRDLLVPVEDRALLEMERQGAIFGYNGPSYNELKTGAYIFRKREISSSPVEIIANRDAVGTPSGQTVTVLQDFYTIAAFGENGIRYLQTIVGPCIPLALWDSQTKTGLFAHIDETVDLPKSFTKLAQHFTQRKFNPEILQASLLEAKQGSETSQTVYREVYSRLNYFNLTDWLNHDIYKHLSVYRRQEQPDTLILDLSDGKIYRMANVGTFRWPEARRKQMEVYYEKNTLEFLFGLNVLQFMEPISDAQIEKTSASSPVELLTDVKLPCSMLILPLDAAQRLSGNILASQYISSLSNMANFYSDKLITNILSQSPRVNSAAQLYALVNDRLKGRNFSSFEDLLFAARGIIPQLVSTIYEDNMQLKFPTCCGPVALTAYGLLRDFGCQASVWTGWFSRKDLVFGVGHAFNLEESSEYRIIDLTIEQFAGVDGFEELREKGFIIISASLPATKSGEALSSLDKSHSSSPVEDNYVKETSFTESAAELSEGLRNIGFEPYHASINKTLCLNLGYVPPIPYLWERKVGTSSILVRVVCVEYPSHFARKFKRGDRVLDVHVDGKIPREISKLMAWLFSQEVCEGLRKSGFKGIYGDTDNAALIKLTKKYGMEPMDFPWLVSLAEVFYFELCRMASGYRVTIVKPQRLILSFDNKNSSSPVEKNIPDSADKTIVVARKIYPDGSKEEVIRRWKGEIVFINRYSAEGELVTQLKYPVALPVLSSNAWISLNNELKLKRHKKYAFTEKFEIELEKLLNIEKGRRVLAVVQGRFGLALMYKYIFANDKGKDEIIMPSFSYHATLTAKSL